MKGPSLVPVPMFTVILHGTLAIISYLLFEWPLNFTWKLIGLFAGLEGNLRACILIQYISSCTSSRSNNRNKKMTWQAVRTITEAKLTFITVLTIRVLPSAYVIFMCNSDIAQDSSISMEIAIVISFCLGRLIFILSAIIAMF